MTMVSKLMLRVGIVTKKQRQSLLIREYVRQQQSTEQELLRTPPARAVFLSTTQLYSVTHITASSVAEQIFNCLSAARLKCA